MFSLLSVKNVCSFVGPKFEFKLLLHIDNEFKVDGILSLDYDRPIIFFFNQTLQPVPSEEMLLYRIFLDAITHN